MVRCMSPKVAHRGISRRSKNSVAFGAKRTWTGRQNRLDRSKMTLNVTSGRDFGATQHVQRADKRSVSYSITSSAVASNLSGRFAQSLHEQRDAILRRMKVEEIAEAIAKLPPNQLARFRRWFTAFETGRADHAQELDSTATKLGRLAGRAFAELKKRTKE